MSTTGDDAPLEQRSWLRRHAAKVVLSLVVAACFGWLLHKGALPVAPNKSSFAHVRWWTLFTYLALWTAVAYVRGARWKLLLDPIAKVPLRRIVAVSFIGFAAIALLPVRTGEAVRPYMIRKKGELSGWAATGTIAAERIIDGLVLCAMLVVGLALSTPLSPLPDHIGNLPISPAVVPKSAYIALAVFMTAFLVMGIFFAQRVWARRMTERVIGVVSPKLATWLADRVEHIADGLRFLAKGDVTVKFVGATIAYWLINAAGNWLLAWGSGFDNFTLPESIVVTGVVALGILVPNAPGFFGAYQFSMYAALALFFPNDLVVGPGGAYVLLMYGSQLFVTVATGAVGLLMEHTGVREAFASGPVSTNLPEGAAPE